MAFGHSRRDFLRFTLTSGAAAVVAAHWARSARAVAPTRPATMPGTMPARGPRPVQVLPAVAAARVALTTGEDRADIAFQALKTFEKEITAAIGNKRIILKPNNVNGRNPVACSDPKNLEGCLEFLKSIGKIGNVVMAESGVSIPKALDSFAALGYNPLADKYGIKFLDLDDEGFEILPVFDQTDMRPRPVRFSKLLLDPSVFIISAAKLKTHDRAVATLSLKNIVFAAPVKTGGFNDKAILHGSGVYGTNFNLAAMAPRLHPHLALIDGYQGMEGNGPGGGQAVEHRVCVASLDWLAADRVGIELMGIDPAKVGYLNYCSQNGMGQYDLSKIEVLGAAVKDHIKQYKLHDSVQQQYQWMTQPKLS